MFCCSASGGKWWQHCARFITMSLVHWQPPDWQQLSPQHSCWVLDWFCLSFLFIVLVLVIICHCRDLWLTDGVCLHVCSVSVPARPMFVDGKSLYYSYAWWHTWQVLCLRSAGSTSILLPRSNHQYHFMYLFTSALVASISLPPFTLVSAV